LESWRVEQSGAAPVFKEGSSLVSMAGRILPTVFHGKAIVWSPHLEFAKDTQKWNLDIFSQVKNNALTSW
jgi:hypothetical protein